MLVLVSIFLLVQVLIWSLMYYPVWRTIKPILTNILNEDNLSRKKTILLFVVFQFSMLCINLSSAGLVFFISTRTSLKPDGYPALFALVAFGLSNLGLIWLISLKKLKHKR